MWRGRNLTGGEGEQGEHINLAGGLPRGARGCPLRTTLSWEAAWTAIGPRFQGGVKTVVRIVRG